MKDSIRKQIIAVVLISQLLLATGLTLATVLYSRFQLLSAFNIMLEGRASSVLAAIHDSEDETQKLIFDSKSLNLPNKDLLEVWDENGVLIWRSANWQGASATLLATRSSAFELAQGRDSYRGIIVHKNAIVDEEDSSTSPLRRVVIIYAASTRELDRRIFEIGFFATGASLLLLLLASIFAAYGISRGLSPMQQLAEEAARVSVRNWTFSPPPEARKKKELAPLISALESTLAGLQRAFDRERQSTADAAHELRTAVAIVKSSLQLLICRPRSNDEYIEGLDHALEDCNRLEALVCGALTLAHAQRWADEHVSRDLPSNDLANSCERSVADLQSLAETRNVELRCLVHTEYVVRANPEDLQAVWLNLLQNAIQYSPKGSSVTVSIFDHDQSTALVVVEDSGSGIPAEHLPHVFERFRRGDASRSRSTGGFGLGLSICKAIVEAYGGHIEITSINRAGTLVSVFLPATYKISSERAGEP